MRLWRLSAAAALVVAGFAACTEDEAVNGVSVPDGGQEATVSEQPLDSGAADAPLADGSFDAEPDVVAMLQAAAPTLITGGPDLYPCTNKVGLASATSNAEIYYDIDYTNDGPDPTPSSTRYAGLFVAPEGMTVAIRSRAYAVGFAASTIAVYYVTFLPSPASLTPVSYAPTSGTFDAAIPVTLTTEPGAFICYTLDGGGPACGPSCCGQPCPPSCTSGVAYPAQPITIGPVADGGSIDVASVACSFFYGGVVRSSNVISQTYSF